jgi:hypothetical protein
MQFHLDRVNRKEITGAKVVIEINNVNYSNQSDIEHRTSRTSLYSINTSQNY